MLSLIRFPSETLNEKFVEMVRAETDWRILDVPVLIHRAGVISPGPGALTVDSAGVCNVLAAGESAGETAVGARRVVADTNVGR